MRESIILREIDKYSSSLPTRFHMPGHKGKPLYARKFPGAAADITELDFSDSLYSPSGIIKDAEDNIAEIMGAKRSFILTDGSTCGVFSMLYAVRELGESVAVLRDSHESVFNALKVLRLRPIIINGTFDNGIYTYTKDSIVKAVYSDKACIGALLTSPNYFGKVLPLKQVKAEMKRGGKLLLVDGAHGAHLRFFKKELHPSSCADMWVDGAHKTLPTLTQGAILSVRNESLIPKANEAVKIFRTTSPSYPIMASVEYGVYFMESEGQKTIRALSAAVTEFKSRLSKKGYVFVHCDDCFKITIDCILSKISSETLYGELLDNNMYPELVGPRFIMFLLSAETSDLELKDLERVLRMAFKRCFTEQVVESMDVSSKPKMRYLDAVNSQQESIPLTEAAGRIAAENVGVFPPCFPTVMAGEKYSRKTVKMLGACKNTYNIENGCVKVVKED